MALYVSAGTRRRRFVLAIIGALVVGLILGLVIGRTSAPTIDGRVRAVRAEAADAATALQRLPIEYSQVLGQAGGESTATIAAAVDSARGQLERTYDKAVWLGADARGATTKAFDAVAAAVRARVDAEGFQQVIDAAVAAIEATFDVRT